MSECDNIWQELQNLSLNISPSISWAMFNFFAWQHSCLPDLWVSNIAASTLASNPWGHWGFSRSAKDGESGLKRYWLHGLKTAEYLLFKRYEDLDYMV